jgi:hypothetical protein
MPVTPELLDQLLKDYMSPEDLLGEDVMCCHRSSMMQYL